MHSRKSVFTETGRIQPGIGASDFSCLDISPPYHTHVIIEKKIPLGYPFTHKNVGKRSRTGLRNEPTDIQIGKDIHIMDKERAITLKKLPGMTDSAPSFPQQVPLIRDKNLCPETILFPQIIDYQVGKMMDIYHNILNSSCFQLSHDMR